MHPPCTCEVAMTGLGFTSNACSSRFASALVTPAVRSYRVWLVLALFALACQVRELAGNPWEGMNVGCNIMKKEMHVEEKSCKTSEPVEFSFCQGTCRSASLSSYQYPYYKTRCECCRAVAATVKKIRLYCPHHEGKNITKEDEVWATRNMALFCKCKPCNINKDTYAKTKMPKRRRGYRSWFF